jgi:hypothetical protein
MNFAEHCEVFVTSTGDDRQIDSDSRRCLLQARAKADCRKYWQADG